MFVSCPLLHIIILEWAQSVLCDNPSVVCFFILFLELRFTHFAVHAISFFVDRIDRLR